MRKRSLFCGGVLFMVSAVLLHSPVQAQTYPSHPIEMTVPLSPGDTVDLAGRAIANEMAKLLNTQVVVVNKPGGGGTVGAGSVVTGKKDGYSILFANTGIYYAQAIDPASVPYNPLSDLDPLCSAVSVPMMLPVSAESPWKSFGDLMSYMKQNPGKVRASSTGVGSVGFFNFEVIRTETGNAFNMIPFKGGSPALTALLGGHVDTGALALGLIAPHVKAGKLRILQTSQKVAEFTDVPTLKQLGYKMDTMSIRFSFYLPAGAPESVKKVLVPAIEKAIKTPEVATAIQQIGALPDFIPGEEFKKMMTEEYAMVKRFMKDVPPEGK
jgi:tripartite-type tricarboxylate transporter receptor subunit TctC